MHSNSILLLCFTLFRVLYSNISSIWWVDVCKRKIFFGKFTVLETVIKCISLYMPYRWSTRVEICILSIVTHFWSSHRKHRSSPETMYTPCAPVSFLPFQISPLSSLFQLFSLFSSSLLRSTFGFPALPLYILL